MKIMALADLHLGKKVHEFSLLADQAYLLDQVMELIDHHRPDGLVLAGDIYDKALPSAEAVRLLDDFLSRLAERDLAVFMIAGNHDSADRLAFAQKMLARQKIQIAGPFRHPLEAVTWQVGDVTADVYLLPFIKPVHVRAVWPESDVTSYDDALGFVIGQLELKPDRFNILIGHQFIRGAATFESDDILIGGVDQVRADHFAVFDLVLLGHLHGPQTIGSPAIRYPGSLMKYSFSEAHHTKSAPLITISNDHTFRTELLPLIPLRDMRVLKGPWDKLTDPAVYGAGNQSDYVQITLTDDQEIPDAITRLRAIYPQLMRLNYDNRRTRASLAFEATHQIQHKTPLELFYEFYHSQNNQPLSDEQSDYISRLLSEMEAGR